jgi:hypothetical protein
LSIKIDLGTSEVKVSGNKNVADIKYTKTLKDGIIIIDGSYNYLSADAEALFGGSLLNPHDHGGKATFKIEADPFLSNDKLYLNAEVNTNSGWQQLIDHGN